MCYTCTTKYRVSIKSFPNYKHLLQENYVEYKIFFYHYLSHFLKNFLSWVTFKKNVCIPRSFLVINVCNQGKTLCSPCILQAVHLLSVLTNLEVITGKLFPCLLFHNLGPFGFILIKCCIWGPSTNLSKVTSVHLFDCDIVRTPDQLDRLFISPRKTSTKNV